MANIFQLNITTPKRLGHKQARKGKKEVLEEKGQLNLFKRSKPKIFSIPENRPLFEQALYADDLEQNQKARELYKKAINEKDSVSDAYCNLGIIESKEGNTSKALDCFTKALTIEPRHFEARFNLANLYFDNGDYKLAHLHYDAASEINPDDPNIYFNLGLTRAICENIEEAIMALEKYLSLVSPNETGPALNLINQLKLTKQLRKPVR